MSDLSAAQQQELAIRAGTLAAGFLAAPLISTLENTLGLTELEVEPGGEFGDAELVRKYDDVPNDLSAVKPNYPSSECSRKKRSISLVASGPRGSV